MKKYFISALTAIVVIIFSSCQKCTVCTYIDQTTGFETIDEYCGSEKQVKDYEADWEADWINNGGYCQRY